MHKVLVNRLGGLSLPRKSVVRLTDRPNMTLDVYRGRKTTIQQQQGAQINISKSKWENFQELTQFSSRFHPRHLVGKMTAQIIITSGSQANSHVHTCGHRLVLHIKHLFLPISYFISNKKNNKMATHHI